MQGRHWMWELLLLNFVKLFIHALRLSVFPRLWTRWPSLTKYLKNGTFPCPWKNKARLRKKTVMKKGRLCKTGFIPAVSTRWWKIFRGKWVMMWNVSWQNIVSVICIPVADLTSRHVSYWDIVSWRHWEPTVSFVLIFREIWMRVTVRKRLWRQSYNVFRI